MANGLANMISMILKRCQRIVYDVYGRITKRFLKILKSSLDDLSSTYYDNNNSDKDYYYTHILSFGKSKQ